VPSMCRANTKGPRQARLELTWASSSGIVVAEAATAARMSGTICGKSCLNGQISAQPGSGRDLLFMETLADRRSSALQSYRHAQRGVSHNPAGAPLYDRRRQLAHILGNAMIDSFELSRYRRVNVWLDERPPAEFIASSMVTRMVKPNMVVDASRRIAAIEINIPHGPRASYALLGAELIESDVDGLEVVVSVNAAGFPFEPSLALKSDEVKVGLLDEYARAVVGGIERMAETSGLPTKAVLRFRWAAHGSVSSSSLIFSELGG
jgi:hypothetical protein